MSGFPPSIGLGSTPLLGDPPRLSVVRQRTPARPHPAAAVSSGHKHLLETRFWGTDLKFSCGANESMLFTWRRPPAAPAAGCSWPPGTPRPRQHGPHRSVASGRLGPVSLVTSDVALLVLAVVRLPPRNVSSPCALLDRAAFLPGVSVLRAVTPPQAAEVPCRLRELDSVHSVFDAQRCGTVTKSHLTHFPCVSYAFGFMIRKL